MHNMGKTSLLAISYLHLSLHKFWDVVDPVKYNQWQLHWSLLKKFKAQQ